jgi:hypothetical protein
MVQFFQKIALDHEGKCGFQWIPTLTIVLKARYYKVADLIFVVIIKVGLSCPIVRARKSPIIAPGLLSLFFQKMRKLLTRFFRNNYLLSFIHRRRISSK